MPFVISCLNGCKGFLETNPSTSISGQTLFKTTEGAQLLLNGIYSDIRSVNIDNMEIFAIMGNDIINYNVGGWLQNYYQHLPSLTLQTSGAGGSFWSSYYTVINNTNSILSNIDKSEGTDETKNAIKGQALTLRAWAYFHLIRLFQQPYAIAKEMSGVPYYDKPTTVGRPRSSVSEIYNHIVQDLKDAIPLLKNYQRDQKDQINQAVAEGILAEVYLTMENWEDAAKMAHNAKQGYPLMSASTFKSGFNNWKIEGWMWALHQTDDHDFDDDSPFAYWANDNQNRIEQGRWSYDIFFVNNNFKDSFSKNDVRYQFIFRSDRNLWTSNKFRDNTSFLGDVPIMRSAEMYLIEAEAYARMKKDTKAKSVLWKLQSIRNANKTQATGDALIDSILVERRKELYGEGFAWFDLIRNQIPVNHKDPFFDVQVPARSWKNVFQIPSAELKSNENINSSDQNPATGVYNPK
jgi:hypothetical protein